MHYETHITVACEDTGRWQETCTALGIRPLVIRLPEGDHPLQLMCAATMDGTFTAARAWMDGIAARLAAEGYDILRTKLESALVDVNPDPALYYECHFKLAFTEQPDAHLLEELKKDGIYASEDLLTTGGGTYAWYMTTRQYGGTPTEARNAFADALTKVRARFAVKAAHFEHVVHDSWPEIDHGWLPLEKVALA
jgi:hypothetical protein